MKCDIESLADLSDVPSFDVAMGNTDNHGRNSAVYS